MRNYRKTSGRSQKALLIIKQKLFVNSQKMPSFKKMWAYCDKNEMIFLYQIATGSFLSFNFNVIFQKMGWIGFLIRTLCLTPLLYDVVLKFGEKSIKTIINSIFILYKRTLFQLKLHITSCSHTTCLNMQNI